MLNELDHLRPATSDDIAESSYALRFDARRRDDVTAPDHARKAGVAPATVGVRRDEGAAG